jgi:hypothetical protein
MTRQELEDWLISKGFIKNRFDHFTKPTVPNFRFKLQSHSVRYEQKVGSGDWVRLKSGYYGQLSISDEGKLSGLKRGALGLKPVTVGAGA